MSCRRLPDMSSRFQYQENSVQFDLKYNRPIHSTFHCFFEEKVQVHRLHPAQTRIHLLPGSHCYLQSFHDNLSGLSGFYNMLPLKLHIHYHAGFENNLLHIATPFGVLPVPNLEPKHPPAKLTNCC